MNEYLIPNRTDAARLAEYYSRALGEDIKPRRVDDRGFAVTRLKGVRAERFGGLPIWGRDLDASIVEETYRTHARTGKASPLSFIESILDSIPDSGKAYRITTLGLVDDFGQDRVDAALREIRDESPIPDRRSVAGIMISCLAKENR